MHLFTLLIWIGLQIGRSLSDSGDCENRDNKIGRNLIHNETLEVDPCATTNIFIKCLKPEVTNCTTTALNGDESAYEFIVGEYEPKLKAVRFALIIPLTSEFYVHASTSDTDGNITGNGEKLGYFDDSVFPTCNSYACCDPTVKTKPNVARRCPYSEKATTLIPDREGFYGVSYLWYPPRGFQGDMIFIAEISDNEAIHYEKLTSKAIKVDMIGPTKPTTSRAQPQPVPTTPASSVKKESTTPEDYSEEPETTSRTSSKVVTKSPKKKKLNKSPKKTTKVATTTERSTRRKGKKTKYKKKTASSPERSQEERPRKLKRRKHRKHADSDYNEEPEGKKTPASDEYAEREAKKKQNQEKKEEPPIEPEENVPVQRKGLLGNLVKIGFL